MAQTPGGSSRGAVLVVEDDEPNLQMLVGWLERAGYEVRRAGDSEAALADLDRQPPDLVMVDARVWSLIRLKRFTDDLESAEAVIMSLALTVEARDAYTDGHCHRLARYATALGRAIGLGADDLEALSRGGYLHDVGKIGIPDSILLKPGLLTPPEFDVIRQHPIIGERLCGDLRALARVRPIVRHHHECLDGSGYPDGLKGDAIPLSAQIVSIADAYDAITTTRPYRAGSTPERAFQELTRDATRGTRRGDLVSAFVSLGGSGALA